MSSEYVVVGGSKGIGLGIVKRLVDAGHSVSVLSRTGGTLQSMDRVRHVPFDATSDDVPADALPAQIQGLVYCPGSINLRSFRALKPETYREDFELNVIGAVKIIQAAQKALKARLSETPASIVLFSTVAVGQGMPMHSSIACSKGAIEGLTRTLAAEFSPDIRVNCLAPALTNTPLTERFFDDESKVAGLAAKYPLKRTGEIDDLANAAHFLLTDQSSWMTGQIVGVDGGMSSVG